MINSTVTTITPKKAKDMLKMNEGNRPLNAAHVDFLAGEIKAGNWKVNGESIKVGKTKLIDGQHRLSAIIQAGKSIKTLVSTGIDEDVFDTVDTGRNRGHGDILALVGERYVNNLAALLALLHRYYDNDFVRTKKISNTEMELLLQKYPDARESVALKHRATGLLSPRIIHFCHYVFSKKDKDMADKFISQLCTGVDLSARSPVYAFRNKVLSAKLSGTKFESDVLIIMLFKAWNMTRAGKSTTRMSIKKGDKIERAK